MNKILLVAAREYRQITRMRSFWLTLLILPLALAIAPLAQRFMDDDDGIRVIVIDQANGGAGQAVIDRLNLDHQRRVLNELSRYVQQHELPADRNDPWAQHDRWYTDAEVARFQAEGGADAALARLKPLIDASTPEFEAPKPTYEIVPTPPQLARQTGAALDRQVDALLQPKDRKAKRLDYALLVPADFARTGAVRLWTAGRPNPALVANVQDVLTRALRQGMLIERGVAPDVAAAASTITPAVQLSQPAPGSGAREAMLVRSVLPLAATYLLMLALMLSGSWMLQGTVEERSNKLLETVLATVSPEELMYGKLIGTVGVGLTMIGVWMACGAVAAFGMQGAIADFIRPALAPLNSFGSIAAMLFFFVVGYVVISVFFLAVGAISDSMNDAQGYLMPMMLIILIPISLLIQSVVQGGQGALVTVMTWVPIWTPFAVLARLGTGIATWEVIGAGLLLTAFAALQLMLLGRLFRASLLAQGQKPSLGELVSRMRRQPS